MKGEDEIDHRHGPVQEAPRAIWEALPERECEQSQQDVEAPFAEILGQILQAVE